MNRSSSAGIIESLRKAQDDHSVLVFWGAMAIGIILRLLATYPPLEHFSEALAELCKEIGNFVLCVFLIAFLYENFINYKTRREAFHELEELLNRRLGSGVRHVYERRPTLARKAEFVEGARHEVIELGVALNRFKEYVVGNMAISDAEGSLGYREFLETLMKRGVHILCFATDPDFNRGLKGTDTDTAKIEQALSKLNEYAASVKTRGYSGGITLHPYAHIAHFAAIMVDPDDPENGKALISPYIPHRENNMTPFFEIHRKESEGLFMAYYSFVQLLKSEMKEEKPPRP